MRSILAERANDLNWQGAADRWAFLMLQLKTPTTYYLADTTIPATISANAAT